MKCETYDGSGVKLLRVEDANPQCGEDFCDSCGDCLDCFDGDYCCGNVDGKHKWVKYEKLPSAERFPNA